jgi:hypothetical protein
VSPPIDERPPTLEHRRTFADERGFFRVQPADPALRDPLRDFHVEPGPPWTTEEAQAETRRFLDALADGRPIAEEHPDALEYAQRNGLLLLIGPDEERHLRRLAKRMPREMAIAWRDALRGGHASDAFGPLAEPERLDEGRVDAELKSGDSTRRRTLVVGGGVLAVLVVAVALFAVLRGGGDDRASGSITFGEGEQAAGGDRRAGPPPAVVPELVARLDQPVAVSAGDGPIENRIVVSPPATDLPQPLGAVAATLFRYNGSGQVVLVGPAGWLAHACVEVSPISQGLRPFETAYYESTPGACAAPTGRPANVGCKGDATVMLDLRLPEGEVGLEEGGTASVSGVRVKLVGSGASYEAISVNGLISVASGNDVAVPTFGGAVGDTVSFDLSASDGTPLIGSCVLS